MVRQTTIAMSLLALAACSQPSPDGTKTFITPLGATIKYTSPDEPFAVLPRAGAAETLYWCAAAQGATHVAPGRERLYLVQPIARGEPALFSVGPPPGGVIPTGLNTIGGDPNSISIAQAQTFCPHGRDS